MFSSKMSKFIAGGAVTTAIAGLYYKRKRDEIVNNRKFEYKFVNCAVVSLKYDMIPFPVTRHYGIDENMDEVYTIIKRDKYPWVRQSMGYCIPIDMSRYIERARNLSGRYHGSVLGEFYDHSISTSNSIEVISHYNLFSMMYIDERGLAAKSKEEIADYILFNKVKGLLYDIYYRLKGTYNWYHPNIYLVYSSFVKKSNDKRIDYQIK